MKITMLCILNTVLMASGQMLFKYGSAGRVIENIQDITRLLFSPTVLIALCLYGTSTMLWLYILTKTPISYAYPIQALAFPLVLLASYFVFHESLSIYRIVGVCVIFIGIFIATRT